MAALVERGAEEQPPGGACRCRSPRGAPARRPGRRRRRRSSTVGQLEADRQVGREPLEALLEPRDGGGRVAQVGGHAGQRRQRQERAAADHAGEPGGCVAHLEARSNSALRGGEVALLARRQGALEDEVGERRVDLQQRLGQRVGTVDVADAAADADQARREQRGVGDLVPALLALDQPERLLEVLVRRRDVVHRDVLGAEVEVREGVGAACARARPAAASGCARACCAPRCGSSGSRSAGSAASRSRTAPAGRSASRRGSARGSRR